MLGCMPDVGGVGFPGLEGAMDGLVLGSHVGVAVGLSVFNSAALVGMKLAKVLVLLCTDLMEAHNSTRSIDLVRTIVSKHMYKYQLQ